MRASILGVALAATLCVFSRAAMSDEYLIDSQVWAWYQQYLRSIANGIKPGAFAISKDGRSAFYSWCQDIRCRAGPTYSQDALGSCQRQHGPDCVVFAVRDEIQVAYEIIGRQEMTLDPPEVEAPVTRIAVTPDVQEKIEIYLRNVRSAGRVWAFAVSRDGTDGAMASCAVGSTYAGGRSCYPVLGTKEDLAKREALARCGGSDDCVLLYLGQQKQGNIEIVAR